eukprot:4204805-Pleurochrysis_carterae.AAC.1
MLSLIGACDAILHDYAADLICTCLDPVRLVSVPTGWILSPAHRRDGAISIRTPDAPLSTRARASHCATVD